VFLKEALSLVGSDHVTCEESFLIGSYIFVLKEALSLVGSDHMKCEESFLVDSYLLFFVGSPFIG
jgi:hypothetical protein